MRARRHLALAVLGLGLHAGLLPQAAAVEAGALSVDSTQIAHATSRTASAPAATGASSTIWTASDTTLAQLWGLTVAEIQRARVLMQGPRGAFSSQQLTPVEALGIHARSDAERDRYARLFAKATYEDTQRVLAWSGVVQAELQRVTAGQPVVSFDNVPKAEVAPEAADMLGVPRSAVVPPKRAKAAVVSRAPASRAIGRAADNQGRAQTPSRKP